MAGRSANRLLSRICVANKGRKGKNTDASAMLTMLPKLALITVSKYLSVLA